MKRSSLLVAVALLASSFAAMPAAASYHLTQQQQAPKFGSDEERAAYEAWFNEKDESKKLALGKTFVEKFPQSEYGTKWVKPWVEGAILRESYKTFTTTLQDFYKGDAAKLEPLTKTGDEILAKQPDQAFIVSQLALATGRGVLGQSYKDFEKSKAYASKALQLLSSEKAPEGWKPEDWASLRKTAVCQLNQYQGLYYLQQPTPDLDQAISYLTKAAESKDGDCARDPNTYWLRSDANSRIYDKLRADYSALSADQKTSDAGKAMLAKIDPVIDKMIDDLARVTALASKPEAKPLQDAARERLTEFWKYRYDGKVDGMNERIKRYEADPTAPMPPSPVASTTPTTPAPAAAPNSGGKPAGRPKGK